MCEDSLSIFNRRFGGRLVHIEVGS